MAKRKADILLKAGDVLALVSSAESRRILRKCRRYRRLAKKEEEQGQWEERADGEDGCNDVWLAVWYVAYHGARSNVNGQSKRLKPRPPAGLKPPSQVAADPHAGTGRSVGPPRRHGDWPRILAGLRSSYASKRRC